MVEYDSVMVTRGEDELAKRLIVTQCDSSRFLPLSANGVRIDCSMNFEQNFKHDLSVRE